VISDWTAFFDRWLTDARRTTHDARDDQIVPSPHMPHLMFEWVLRRAKQRWLNRDVGVGPVPGAFATPLPYDRSSDGSDETRYVSWADWICPTHCIEPALCPAIGAPRTWEMSDSVRELAERLQARLALFICKHQVFGVGMFAASEVIAGDRLIEQVGSSGMAASVLVGTISSCHGALNLLTLGPQPSAIGRQQSTPADG
jgi:hypothetical protein